MYIKFLAVAAALLSAAVAQAACYTVYKADGTLLQESSTTPVNLSLPIGDTVPEKFGPGTTMTISGGDVYCRDAKERQTARPSLADALHQEEMKGQPGAKKEMAIKVADLPQADATKTAAK
jgi:hypothetical protein